MAIEIGRKYGDYTIDRCIGAGGMATVYRACRVVHGARIPVALKVLREPLAVSKALVRRFHREAQNHLRLGYCDQIVPCLDAGLLSPPGLPFLAMPLLEGGSMRGLLLGLRSRGLFLPTDVAVFVLENVLLALQHAHDRGILHRDLTVNNVLFSPGGLPKVADFGIALDLRDLPSERMTTGVPVGTWPNMSPEQWDNDIARMDFRSDIYQAGCAFYSMLTGRAPFPPTNSAEHARQQVLAHEVVPIRAWRPDVPEAIEALAQRLMALRPADRPQSAGDALRLVEETLPQVPFQRSLGWLAEAVRVFALPGGVDEATGDGVQVPRRQTVLLEAITREARPRPFDSLRAVEAALHDAKH